MQVRSGPLTSAALGAALGPLVLHPATMLIAWVEFRPGPASLGGAADFLLYGMRTGGASMAAMTALFVAVGAGYGLLSGLSTQALARRARRVDGLERELGRSLPSLLQAGESEQLEFKASARWSYREGQTSRAVEEAAVRAIAALLNHRGGTLLLGVGDRGEVLGLANDYASLRRRDRDGFQQFLMGQVERRLGADACALLHVVFHGVDGREVCRVVVEPSPVPIYVRDDDGAHYWLRTGNTTRELDVREALDHIAARRARHVTA